MTASIAKGVYDAGSTLRIGPIEQVFLFGGGSTLLSLIPVLQRLGMRVWVITAPRLAREHVEGERTLESALRSRGIPVCVWEEISAGPVPLPFVNPKVKISTDSESNQSPLPYPPSPHDTLPNVPHVLVKKKN